jgi:hypothetical protein
MLLLVLAGVCLVLLSIAFGRGGQFKELLIDCIMFAVAFVLVCLLYEAGVLYEVFK